MPNNKDKSREINNSKLFPDVAKETGFSAAQVSLVVNSYIDHLKEKMGEGIAVNVKGFAIFGVVYTPAVPVRDPRNGTPMVMKPRFTPKAQMSRSFKQHVKDLLVPMNVFEYEELKSKQDDVK